MLTCCYHAYHGMRVFEEDEAQILKDSGEWFDSPTKAKSYKDKLESIIEEETKPKNKGNKK